ncbi:CorA family divalent cation transporter [Stratiformator vulcanicus]|uniref:CorA family divalent cation transporter n=1 Tax=Stratiformator vulcanicus TaxID=2527980 RepID=UPI0011A9212A
MATLFIPLSFIAGLYGMNFNTQASKWNILELNWAMGITVRPLSRDFDSLRADLL